MYIHTSSKVCPLVRDAWIKKIQECRRELVKDDGAPLVDHTTEFTRGPRFNRDEDVFQALCMIRTSGFEIDQSEVTDREVLAALINAGQSDYFYIYEKEY